jgi:hypothetical protein
MILDSAAAEMLNAEVETAMGSEPRMLLKTTRRGMARLGGGSHAGSHTVEQLPGSHGPAWTTGREETEVMNRSEQGRTAAQESTDQKVRVHSAW